jgi:MYXO-CTERM domain-containing protein
LHRKTLKRRVGMPRRTLAAVAATAFLALAGAGPAGATLFTFDTLTPTGTIDPCYGVSCPTPALELGGFRFEAPNNGNTSHFHLVSAPFGFSVPGQSQDYPYNGTQYIGLDTSLMRMSRIDGGRFSLHGFDAAEGFIGNGLPVRFASFIQVVGTLAGGGSVSELIALDGINDSVGGQDDFQSFALSGAFDNLVSVDFIGLDANQLAATSPGGDNLFSLDNVSVTATPEPGALALFALGIAGLLRGGRRSVH